jgi:hypothetical protein
MSNLPLSYSLIKKLIIIALCFSFELLASYVDQLMCLKLVKRCDIGSGWADIFNNYSEQHGSDVRLVSLNTDQEKLIKEQ